MEGLSPKSIGPSFDRSVRRRSGRRRGDPLERVPITEQKSTSRRSSATRRQRSDKTPEAVLPAEPDPLGKMALYSGDEPRRPLGTLVVECSSCKRETPVSGVALLRSALPFSLHLPLVRRFSSYMRCPACGRRTWLRITWRA